MRSPAKSRKILASVAGASALALSLVAGGASAQVRITEWMYNGLSAGGLGEFVELTNLGAAPVNFLGWSFDDSSRTPGAESLSGFGLVAPGESVIFTEAAAAAFRLSWSLPASVKILGGNTNNLGRSDEINIYDDLSNLVDRLTYNDQGAGNVRGVRTQNVGGIPSVLAALGANNASLWVLSAVGDGKGSFTSADGDIGSPGFSPFAPTTTVVPVPGAALLMAGGLALVGFAARRRRAS